MSTSTRATFNIITIDDDEHSNPEADRPSGSGVYYVERTGTTSGQVSNSMSISGFENVSNPMDPEDEDEVDSDNDHHPAVTDQTSSIKDFLMDAKRLLVQALEASEPEQFHQDHSPAYLYNFSSRVTANDLMTHQEWQELSNIVSTLQSRLGVQRVLNLGCPQLRSERQLFDQLLLRCSSELLIPDDNSWAHRALSEFSTPSLQVDNGSTSGAASNVNQSSLGGVPIVERSSPVQSVFNDMEAISSSPSHTRTDFTILQNCVKTLRDSGLPALLASPCRLEEESHSTQVFQCFLKMKDALSSLLEVAMAGATQQVTTPKRKRKREEEGSEEAETGQKKAKVEENEEEQDDEEESCAICLEPWSTGGEHRVSCLKCGHLFGLSCITKWVAQAHSCPQCKAPARKADIRNIFVRKITAEDTSERDRALRLLEEERKSRRLMEQKEASTRKRLDLQIADMQTQVTQLQARLQKAGCGSSSQGVPLSQLSSKITGCQNTVGSKRFCLLHRVNITQEPSCRVFDHCQGLGLTVVSQRSTNALFRGFGIKILSRDFKPLSYLPLHTSMIRDMSFRPATYDGMLLSGGMDKSVQLASVTSKCVIQKYSLSSTVWCCAWNTSNTNLFYAGMEKGVVKEFDLRNTSGPVADILDVGGSPVTSLQYWSGDSTHGDFQGLLIGQMQTLVFREQKPDGYTSHHLPHLPASLMSLSLHSNGMFLTSFRPGSSLPKCRYEVSSLHQQQQSTEASITSRRLSLWDGSNVQAVISRNCLISHPGSADDVLAVTANHSNSTVNIWDVGRHREFQNLTSYDKALDIRPVMTGADSPPLLGALTDRDLVLYQWR